MAATGVGAGDMVSSLNAGTVYGTIFLWAIIVGALVKFYLTEGIGRWYMATGRTILDGWRSLGDRKSTRLNSSHANISYAVFCLKKKNINNTTPSRGA